MAFSKEDKILIKNLQQLKGYTAIIIIIIIIIIIMKAKIIVTLYIKIVTGALYTVNYNESTLSVSVNAAWNSVVLTARQNDCSEVADLTDEGRAFQARAAATGKARSPSVERRVDGTISVDDLFQSLPWYSS